MPNTNFNLNLNLNLEIDNSYKYPKDVFELLINILRMLTIIVGKFGGSSIEILEVESLNTSSVSPNEVKELSLMILSELELICLYKNINTSELITFNPGKKYPFNVYQRGMLLKSLIEEMLLFINNNPSWVVEEDN